MKKVEFVGAAVTVALGAILLSAPAASAVQVSCVDNNFVQVTYHTVAPVGNSVDCFAGRGWNEFVGQRGFTSWMTHIHTGNNDVTFRDCNGALVDVPRYQDVEFKTSRCIRDLGIKPY